EAMDAAFWPFSIVGVQETNGADARHGPGRQRVAVEVGALSRGRRGVALTALAGAASAHGDGKEKAKSAHQCAEKGFGMHSRFPHQQVYIENATGADLETDN